VALTLACGGSFLTTVPSCVLPCEVHSQNPPTGIVVAQASLPAWQILAAEAVLAQKISAKLTLTNRMAKTLQRATPTIKSSLVLSFKKELLPNRSKDKTPSAEPAAASS
jgi:hypothetical protein